MSSLRRTSVLLASMLAVAVGLVGCSRQVELPPPRYSHQQASDIVEQQIRDAAANLSLQPTLVFSNAGQAPCSGPNDDWDTDQVMVERSYWLHDVDPANNDAVIAQLIDYWHSHGYRVVRDDGPQPLGRSRWIVAHNADLDFDMWLVQALNGALSLNAQSPCVYDPRVSSVAPTTPASAGR